jgi:anti-sigma28 factor (negative regulator of flagellin synthesis)
MDPTRPLDTKKTPIRPAGQKTAGPTGAATNAHTTSQVGSAKSGVSLELSDLGLSRTEARRIDSQRLEALKEAIANDTYEVDADALSRRILDDALGPENLE